MNNKSVYDILEEVAATASKNEKLTILAKHKDNQNLKETIRLAYDPFTNFYIRKIPEYKNLPVTGGRQALSWAIQSLDGLSSRQYTGNEGIDYLKNILYLISPENSSVIERIIGRDLRAGFSESTANKVWPNLVSVYPCMLCSTMDEKLLAKIKFPAYFQMKLDGMRFNAIVRDNKVEYRSRNGKPLELFGILDDYFIRMAGGKEYIYDGELLILDDLFRPLPRQTGNGILQRAAKGKGTKQELEKVACVLWDVIDYDSFINGKKTVEYGARFDLLQHQILWQAKAGVRITFAETHTVSSIEEVQVLYKKYLAAGQEGGILKAMNASWEDGRSRQQIKFKNELEADLLCVGYEKGTGKNSDRLGALSLESKDGVIKVRVGSGFTDADRDEFTEKNTIGKIVSIKYNTRIKDSKTEQESLFLPIFLEVRDDKTVADNSKTIK